MRRSAVLAPGLALALSLVAPAVARADDLTPADFVRELARARHAVEEELEHAREGADVDLDRLRRASERLSHARVATPGGPVEADPGVDRAVEALGSIDGPSEREEKLDALAKRIHSLEREASRARARAELGPTSGTHPATDPGAATSPDGKTPAPAERAHEALNKVLERPHYRRRTASEAESSGLAERFESLLQRIENWWERTFIPPPPSAPTPPSWLQKIVRAIGALFTLGQYGAYVWAGIVLLAILLVTYKVSKKRRAAKADEEETFEEIDTEGAVRPAVEESYSEAHWRREARLLADRGDHRSAVRALYTGLLLLLERGGRLKFDKGRTNWEHLRELRRNDRALAARMEPLTRTFDVVWYGRAPVARSTFDTFLAGSDELARAAELKPAEAGP